MAPAAAAGTVVFSGANLSAVLSGTDGPVALHIARLANRVRSEAVQRCPVDTSRLRSSIRYSIVKDAQGLAAIIGTDVHYAIYVHEGTRPHLPPPGALGGWAKRHGFSSPYPVAVAIAARGTRGRPFLTQALQAAITTGGA